MTGFVFGVVVSPGLLFGIVEIRPTGWLDATVLPEGAPELHDDSRKVMPTT